jgi:hypothetical protein
VGQPIVVSVRETLDPHVRVYDTNRWLTGMGSGVFTDVEMAPSGSMAKMILETGSIDAVHVYGSSLTLTKKPSASWQGLAEDLQKRLENFYIYYPENIGKKFEAAADDGDGDDDAPAEEDAG